MTTEKWQDIEDKPFTPTEISALQEADSAFRKAFRWLHATTEQARGIAARAGFPRSISGKFQNDALARRIFYIKQRCQDANLVPLEIVKTVSAVPFPCPDEFSSKLETSSAPDCILHQVNELYDLVTELAKQLNHVAKSTKQFI